MRFKEVKQEAIEYAQERAQRLGNVQRVVEAAGGYRVGSEKSISWFYPEALGWNVNPIN